MTHNSSSTLNVGFNQGVPEGSADSGWILLDYGEVMVHIMTPKSRLFYDIEGQVSVISVLKYPRLYLN